MGKKFLFIKGQQVEVTDEKLAELRKGFVKNPTPKGPMVGSHGLGHVVEYSSNGNNFIGKISNFDNRGNAYISKMTHVSGMGSMQFSSSTELVPLKNIIRRLPNA